MNLTPPSSPAGEPVKTRSNDDMIYDLVRELHGASQIVTPELLTKMSGLGKWVVKDIIAKLVDHRRIARVRAGVYKPLGAMAEPRAVSSTVLPNGMVKIEIGDVVLDLVPQEVRNLGALTAGHAMHLAQIEANSQFQFMASELGAKISDVTRRLGAIESPPKK